MAGTSPMPARNGDGVAGSAFKKIEWGRLGREKTVGDPAPRRRSSDIYDGFTNCGGNAVITS